MKDSQLNKVLRIIRRTNDRLLVLDKESDEVVVAMSLEGYESLLDNSLSVRGMSEGEMMDKINRDIALWRSHNDGMEEEWNDMPEEAAGEFSSIKKNGEEYENYPTDFSEDWDVDFGEDEISEREMDGLPIEDDWQSEEGISFEDDEDDLDDILDEEDESEEDDEPLGKDDEDRFYLEPV